MKHLTQFKHLSLLAGLGLASSLSAAVIDFDTAADYTDNFYRSYLETGSGGAFAYSASAEAVRHTSSGSGSAVFVYDTAPDTTATDTFGNVTVSFDFSAATSNTSFGVYFGGASRTNAALAIFNLNTGTGNTNETLRFFTGGNLNTGAAGTQVGGAGGTTTLTNGGFTVNTTYHATLTIEYLIETPTSANVTFTISDPYTVSSPLSSFSKTSLITGLSLEGEIGFRSGFSSGGTGINTIDNIDIAAVPEPSTFAAFGGIAVLGFAAVRRRRRA